MKILMVAPYPYPGEPIRGGVETVTYNLVEGFKQIDNIELKILSIFRDFEDGMEVNSNISISFVKSKYSSQNVELKRHIKKIILNINKEWNPDIIHIQGNGSNFLLYDKSIQSKLVITQHGILWQELKQAKNIHAKLSKIVAWIIERILRSNVKNWVYISNYNLNLHAGFIRKNHINYRQIYNPVNPKFFQRISKSRNNGSLSLLFVGRLIPRKGLADLLVAIAKSKMSNLYLYVIGGYEFSEYETEIKKIIDKYSLSNVVKFHGWKTSDEIIEIYKDIDAFVLPSYQETLPCVIAEAMALGNIVIATEVGGIPEMVSTGETGFLYPAGDTIRLSEILREIGELESDKIEKMSSKSKELAMTLYNPKYVAEAHYDFYKSIMRQHQVGSM